MYKDGNVSKNVKYNEVCQYIYEDHANIAYNTDPPYFDVDTKTNSMIKYSERLLKGDTEWISKDWEILEAFFNQNKIVPNFINCYNDRGGYNKSSGKHSGSVGKVLMRNIVLKII